LIIDNPFHPNTFADYVYQVCFYPADVQASKSKVTQKRFLSNWVPSFDDENCNLADYYMLIFFLIEFLFHRWMNPIGSHRIRLADKILWESGLRILFSYLSMKTQYSKCRSSTWIPIGFRRFIEISIESWSEWFCCVVDLLVNFYAFHFRMNTGSNDSSNLRHRKCLIIMKEIKQKVFFLDQFVF
jgi:hypothetical protein